MFGTTWSSREGKPSAARSFTFRCTSHSARHKQVHVACRCTVVKVDIDGW